MTTRRYDYDLGQWRRFRISKTTRDNSRLNSNASLPTAPDQVVRVSLSVRSLRAKKMTPPHTVWRENRDKSATAGLGPFSRTLPDGVVISPPPPHPPNEKKIARYALQ